MNNKSQKKSPGCGAILIAIVLAEIIMIILGCILEACGLIKNEASLQSRRFIFYAIEFALVYLIANAISSEQVEPKPDEREEKESDSPDMEHPDAAVEDVTDDEMQSPRDKN